MKIVAKDIDKRAFTIAKGKERVNLFSWEKTAKATLEGYKKIL